MRSTRPLIIRHGESEADILDVHEGRADFELTGRGRRQAEAMSEYVSQHYHIARIYHSPLKRAAQTAPHLAASTQAPLVPDEHLMEFNNGLLAENDADSTLAVVTHGGMTNQLYRAYFRLPIDAGFAFGTGDACIHEWLANGSCRTLVRANFMPHSI